MQRSDEEIQHDIRRQWEYNNRVDASDLEVEVSNGRATLSGAAPSYPALEAAETDARVIPGVRSVENRMAVRPPTEEVSLPTDDEIRIVVERLLLQAPDVNIADLSVSVVDGEVILQGAVDQLWKKFRAREIVGIVAGVRKIDNRLAVIPTESVLDRIIGEGIESALQRMDTVDAGPIDVEVKDGVVRLAGEVPDHRSLQAAQEVARTCKGVVEVYNELRVR
jgi:osmotically-inducible protein OsmY